MVKKWRERSSSRSNSPQSEGETPFTQRLKFTMIYLIRISLDFILDQFKDKEKVFIRSSPLKNQWKAIKRILGKKIKVPAHY